MLQPNKSRAVMTALFLGFIFLYSGQDAKAETGLITNGSLESSTVKPGQPDGWYQGGYGKNERVFSYPITGYSGQAVKVEIKKYAGGDAKWYFQRVPVTPGQRYVYSNRYKSDLQTSVVVQYQTASGAPRYEEIGKPLPSADWSLFWQELFIPDEITALTVFHLLKGVGYLITDEYDLSKPASADSVPPSVSVIQPASGQTVSATTTVSANAVDNVSVAGVRFLLDDLPLGAEMIAPPFSFAWDTRNAINGFHAISARARDAAGNSATSAAIGFVVNNIEIVPPPPPPPPPPNPDPANLIANPSLETTALADPASPDRWFRGGYGSNKRSYAYPVPGFDGARAAQVAITEYADGDAKWYFQPVAVSSGAVYEFSDHYRSSIPSTLVADYQLLNGSHQYIHLLSLPAADTWVSASVIFTVPSNVASLAVFHLIGGIGWLALDAVSLKKIIPEGDAFPRGMVSLDFDDGYLGTYQNGLPILNRAGIKSAQYIISESLGEPLYMTSEQVLEANRAGHEIGAHTRTHPFLTQLSTEQVRYEVEGSKQDLVSLGATPVSVFVYPYGDYDERVKQVVKDAGFIGARSVQEGFNTRSTDPFALRDQHVTSDVPPERVFGWIDQARADSSWLILEFHNTLVDGGYYSHTPETLQRIVDYIVESGIKVITASEGIGLLVGG